MRHYPVMPWPGGKRRLAKILLPIIEGRPHTCYHEPFSGAASMLFMRSIPAEVEVLNDSHAEVGNLYRVIKNHLEEFIRQFKYSLASRQIFEWAKATPPEVLTDIQRAARFLYLQKLSFGAKVTGRTFGISPSAPPRWNILRLEEDLSQAHLRLARVWIETLDWSDSIRRYDREYTLHFADPPYWQTEGYGSEFRFEEYEKLAEVMATCKGSMILTINDHPDMRRVFKRFRCQTADINYTIGGAGRSGKRQELIFENW